MTKICCRCKLEKDHSFFGKDKRGPDSLSRRCKLCAAEVYRLKHPKVEPKVKAPIRPSEEQRQLDILECYLETVSWEGSPNVPCVYFAAVAT